MINVRDRLTIFGKPINFLTIINHRNKNLIYVQDLDIKITENMIPSIIVENNIISRNPYSYHLIAYENLAALKNALNYFEVNYVVASILNNRIYISESKNFMIKNNYMKFKSFLTSEVSKKTQTNNKIIKKSKPVREMDDSSLQGARKPRTIAKSTLKVLEESKRKRNFNITKNRPQNASIIKRDKITPKTNTAPQMVTSRQNRDKSHLNDQVNSKKAVKRTHRRFQPDPEKPSWGDMKAKRYGDFFK